jgi:hypothetical protein
VGTLGATPQAPRKSPPRSFVWAPGPQLSAWFTDAPWIPPVGTTSLQTLSRIEDRAVHRCPSLVCITDCGLLGRKQVNATPRDRSAGPISPGRAGTPSPVLQGPAASLGGWF